MTRAAHARLPYYAITAALAWLFFSGSTFSQTEITYAEARAAFEKGDYTTAAVLFDSVEKESSSKTDALFQVGKCYAHLSRFAEAEGVLQRFLTQNPNSAESLYLLGFVLNRENKPEESLAIYTRAAAITPPTGDDLKIVALDYVLLKDYRDAIRWLERAVEMEPKNKDAWYYLGRACYVQSLPEKSRKAFEMVLSLDPRDVKAEDNLGLLYENEGKTDAAIDCYRKSIEWQTGSAHISEQPYLNLGNLYLSQERLEEALPLLEKAVALAPANGQAHMRLGVAYLRRGHTKEALTQLEEAVRLDPDDGPSHYQLGRCYAQLKNAAAAKREFERVAEIERRSNETMKAPDPRR